MTHRLIATGVLLATCGTAALLAQGRQAPAPKAAPASTAVAWPDPSELSIERMQELMGQGVLSARQLTAAYLARIAAYDQQGPGINAMIALNPHALADAEALDRERASKGPRGPLHGIPVVVKDNYETLDMPTTGGTSALAGFMPGRDAFQVKRLRDAGAVIVGKTNMHELAAGITTISSLGGQTRNPYDLARTPGGSSGGTGAAVAANFGAAGMGSDTCGSIRIPSANNNLFGLRGTLGLSSRAGIIPLSHTQDIGGPLARSAADLAIMLDATAGADPADPTTAASAGRIPQSYRALLKADALKGARIGVLRNFVGTNEDDGEVTAIVLKAVDAMKAAGATVVDVTVPGLDDILNGSAVIAHEFKFDLMDYLAQFPQAPVHSLGEILEHGDYDVALEATFTTRNKPETRETEDYRKARVKRAASRALIDATFEELKLDGLVYPTLRRRPAVIGEPQRGTTCQLSASTGLPALAMPAGFTPDGVPVGLEVLGPAWSEGKLLAFAHAYEVAARPRRAPASTPPLVSGNLAPAPTALRVVFGSGVGVRASAGWDELRGRLTLEVVAPQGQGLRLATVHRAAPGAPNGPVLLRLDVKGDRAAGVLTLSAPDREALAAGRLYLEVKTPSATARAVLPPGS